jgi:hypothetical protein
MLDWEGHDVLRTAPVPSHGITDSAFLRRRMAYYNGLDHVARAKLMAHESRHHETVIMLSRKLGKEWANVIAGGDA